MATVLSFLAGRQITDSNGDPVSGALLYHYQAGTTNDLTVYSNQAGTTPHAQPIVCDAGGFVPLVYIGDASDWKAVIQTSGGATLRSYDDLPSAVAEVSADNFAPPLRLWVQVTSANSPVALTAADAGKAYEANTSGGSIEFDLPSAASVGNGKGFVFKKTSQSNSMLIDPNGSETLENSSNTFVFTANNTCIGIYSNGAEWYIVEAHGHFSIFNDLPENTSLDPDADFVLHYDTSASLSKKVKPNAFPGALYAIIEDRKAQNTNGGELTGGTDNIRALNTLAYNRASTVSLSSNQFTLPAGNWEISWDAPAFQVNHHQSMLYDVTGATVVARGSSEMCELGEEDVYTTRSFGCHRAALSGSRTFEIRHNVETTNATDGGGSQANRGQEVYTRVVIRAA